MRAMYTANTNFEMVTLPVLSLSDRHRQIAHIASVSPTVGATMNRVPLPDEAAHQDGVLMSELTAVNTLLGRYILRILDADAGRTTPMSTTHERALADQVTKAADNIRARADRRDRHGNSYPAVNQGANSAS